MKILIIEDDQSVAELERDYLEINGGFQCDLYTDGTQGLQAALAGDYALVIVDVMLPGLSGFEICRRLREVKDTPVIIISALADDIDKVRGLGLGADDYMTKPPDKTELLLRIKALLRRARIVDEHKITVGDVVVDMDSRTVRRGMEVQTLPPKEFELLYKLLAYPERTFTRMELLDEIWGIDSESDDKTVNVHINRLRNRFYDWPEFEIQTVRGLGYRAVKKV
jgi:two-component system OmpR family response regulator